MKYRVALVCVLLLGIIGQVRFWVLLGVILVKWVLLAVVLVKCTDRTLSRSPRRSLA
jgi:signal recognition particle receptor subunit beta